MKEIEILVEIQEHNPKLILNTLKKFKYNGEQQVIDTYYYDPLRQTLKPHQDNKLYSCFRIREKNGKTYITYKDDVYENSIWQYSDEYETTVNDKDIIKSIINKLGLETLIILSSKKTFYSYNQYEIIFEEVENLGFFLEVELQYDSELSNYKEEKIKIQNFIDSLNLNVSQELNSGKPELYIKKHNLYNLIK